MNYKMRLISVGVGFGFLKIKEDRYVPVMSDPRCSTHLPTMITSTFINTDPEAGDINKWYRCCIYMPFTLLESSIQLGNCAIIFFSSPFRTSLQLNKSGKT